MNIKIQFLIDIEILGNTELETTSTFEKSVTRPNIPLNLFFQSQNVQKHIKF